MQAAFRVIVGEAVRRWRRAQLLRRAGRHSARYARPALDLRARERRAQRVRPGQRRSERQLLQSARPTPHAERRDA